MSPAAVITRCSFVNETGYGCTTQSGTWAEAGKDALHWKTIAREPFPRFGRLDPLCRHAVAAVELLGLDVPADEAVDPRTAVVFHSSHGCLDTDAAFIGTLSQPGGGSPKLFSYTLPSVALGEIAIRYRLGGQSTCVMSADPWSIVAIWEGVDLVASGAADACVCVAAEAVPDEAAACAAAAECGRFAHAFLVERTGTPGAIGSPLAHLFVEDGDATPCGESLRTVHDFLLGGATEPECVLPSPVMAGTGRKLALRRAMT